VSRPSQWRGGRFAPASGIDPGLAVTRLALRASAGVISVTDCNLASLRFDSPVDNLATLGSMNLFDYFTGSNLTLL